ARRTDRHPGAGTQCGASGECGPTYGRSASDASLFRCTAGARGPAGARAPGQDSEIPAQRLLALDGFEEGLEIALAEAARALALDDLVEHRRPVLHRLGEDLKEIALVVP